MIFWTAMGGIVLVVGLLVLAFWAFYRAGREAGYEEGRADAAAELLEQRRQIARETAAGRHAAPPSRRPRGKLPAGPPRTPLEAGRGPLWQYQSARLWTDAAGIGPVTMPTIQAAAVRLTVGSQPSRYPLENTGMMGKLTDTGEIRALAAVTDAEIARIRADNAAWLAKWSAGAAL